MVTLCDDQTIGSSNVVSDYIEHILMYLWIKWENEMKLSILLKDHNIVEIQ